MTSAIRSGDYYMFEDYGDYEGLAPLEIPEEPNEDDATPGMTVSEVDLLFFFFFYIIFSFFKHTYVL